MCGAFVSLTVSRKKKSQASMCVGLFKTSIYRNVCLLYFCPLSNSYHVLARVWRFCPSLGSKDQNCSPQGRCSFQKAAYDYNMCGTSLPAVSLKNQRQDYQIGCSVRDVHQASDMYLSAGLLSFFTPKASHIPMHSLFKRGTYSYSAFVRFYL